MEGRSFSLDDVLKRSARIRTGGSVLATVVMSLGLALLTVVVSTLFTDAMTSMLGGLGVFLISLIFTSLILDSLRHGFEPELRRAVHRNLVDRDLLLLTMQDDAAERLPHLRRKHAPGLDATSETGSFRERLRLLAGKYHHVCRDAGLEPFPLRFGHVRWVSFVAGMVCLMGNGVFSISYLEGVAGGILRPVCIGVALLFLSIFLLLNTMVGAIVTEELVKALEAGDQRGA